MLSELQAFNDASFDPKMLSADDSNSGGISTGTASGDLDPFDSSDFASLDYSKKDSSTQSICDVVTIPPRQRQIQLINGTVSRVSVEVGFSIHHAKQDQFAEITEDSVTEEYSPTQSTEQMPIDSVRFMIVGPIQQDLVAGLSSEQDKDAHNEAILERIFGESNTIFLKEECRRSDGLFTQVFPLQAQGWYQLAWQNNSRHNEVQVSFLCQVTDEEAGY
jgi:hypothetical protein